MTNCTNNPNFTNNTGTTGGYWYNPFTQYNQGFNVPGIGNTLNGFVPFNGFVPQYVPQLSGWQNSQTTPFMNTHTNTHTTPWNNPFIGQYPTQFGMQTSSGFPTGTFGQNYFPQNTVPFFGYTNGFQNQFGTPVNTTGTWNTTPTGTLPFYSSGYPINSFSNFPISSPINNWYGSNIPTGLTSFGTPAFVGQNTFGYVPQFTAQYPSSTFNTGWHWNTAQNFSTPFNGTFGGYNPTSGFYPTFGYNTPFTTVQNTPFTTPFNSIFGTPVNPAFFGGFPQNLVPGYVPTFVQPTFPVNFVPGYTNNTTGGQPVNTTNGYANTFGGQPTNTTTGTQTGPIGFQPNTNSTVNSGPCTLRQVA